MTAPLTPWLTTTVRVPAAYVTAAATFAPPAVGAKVIDVAEIEAAFMSSLNVAVTSGIILHHFTRDSHIRDA